MRSKKDGKTEPSTPPERAFLLQMHGPTRGRVEHILSGNVKSFSTVNELGQAITEMLRERTPQQEKKS
jgi:hypothetical protein